MSSKSEMRRLAYQDPQKIIDENLRLSAECDTYQQSEKKMFARAVAAEQQLETVKSRILKLDEMGCFDGSCPHEQRIECETAMVEWIVGADNVQETTGSASVDKWRPIDTAPVGEPGVELCSRCPSEWFLARQSDNRPVCVRRRGSVGEFSYEFTDAEDNYYSETYFKEWMPIQLGSDE